MYIFQHPPAGPEGSGAPAHLENNNITQHHSGADAAVMPYWSLYRFVILDLEGMDPSHLEAVPLRQQWRACVPLYTS